LMYEIRAARNKLSRTMLPNRVRCEGIENLCIILIGEYRADFDARLLNGSTAFHLALRRSARAAFKSSYTGVSASAGWTYGTPHSHRISTETNCTALA